jgi:hypothetical protein
MAYEFTDSKGDKYHFVKAAKIFAKSPQETSLDRAM